MRVGDPLAGYRLTATDVDRTRERGPEVRGRPARCCSC
jgi:hypothetical protein